jgi:hypothetical protein
VKVEVARIDHPVVSDQSIDIPYAITIKEGGIYKLGTIDFPASALVARAQVEKIVSKYPAGSGRPLEVTSNVPGASLGSRSMTTSPVSCR